MTHSLKIIGLAWPFSKISLLKCRSSFAPVLLFSFLKLPPENGTLSAPSSGFIHSSRGSVLSPAPPCPEGPFLRSPTSPLMIEPRFSNCFPIRAPSVLWHGLPAAPPESFLLPCLPEATLSLSPPTTSFSRSSPTARLGVSPRPFSVLTLYTVLGSFHVSSVGQWGGPAPFSSAQSRFFISGTKHRPQTLM